MKLTKIVALAASALALGAAACGDEEQDTQTREELITKANSICGDTEKGLTNLDRPTNRRSTTQLNDYYGQLAGIYESRLIELDALDPGEDTENAWRAYIAEERERSDALNRIAAKLARGDRSALNDIDQLDQLGREASERARQAGARRCA